MEILLLIWIVIVGVDIMFNYIWIEYKHERPQYLQLFILRMFIGLIYDILWNPQNWGDIAPVMLFQAASHYVLFGPGLNKLRLKKFWYKGLDSGWIDKLPIYLYQRLYYVSAFALICSLIWLYCYGL